MTVRASNEKISENLGGIEKQVQDKVVLVHQTKELQGKLKQVHMKIELFKVEVRKIEELKNTIRKKEEDIKRIEKVFKNSRNVHLRYESFIKDKNPILVNKELKKKLESIKGDRDVQSNQFLNSTKDTLIEEIKGLRDQIEAKNPDDYVGIEDAEEIEMMVNQIMSR